jgi:phosphatidylglycerophosphatase C
VTGARRTVAAFDFDGTISRRDTLVPFLGRVVGRRRVATTLVGRGPQLAGMLAGRVDRDAEKEELIRRLLRGRTTAEIETAGAAYADALWAAGAFRPEIRERLAWHREEGHDIVIVSASLRDYLAPLAPRLGADHVIACTLESEPDGRLTGELVGGNCRGVEKVRRLEAWLASVGHDDPEVYAYGDSSGDDELLARADHPVRVGSARRRPRPPA